MRDVYGSPGEAAAVRVVCRNDLGEPMEFAALTVNSGGSAATIYADSALSTVAANPVTANGNGVATFYAAPGVYTFTVAGSPVVPESVTVHGSPLPPVTLKGSNTGVGQSSLYSNTTGGNNTGVGQSSLRSNTTGGSNTGVGQSSLYSNTTGVNNTGVGRSAGYAPAGNTANATVAGNRNTFFGCQSGASDATDPSDTTAVGYQALVSGTGAVSLGSGAAAKAAGAVALGYGTVVTVANQVAFGSRHLRVDKITDPGVSASATATLYLRDNGSGKMQLVVQFPTGSPIILATEA